MSAYVVVEDYIKNQNGFYIPTKISFTTDPTKIYTIDTYPDTDPDKKSFFSEHWLLNRSPVSTRYRGDIRISKNRKFGFVPRMKYDNSYFSDEEIKWFYVSGKFKSTMIEYYENNPDLKKQQIQAETCFSIDPCPKDSNCCFTIPDNDTNNSIPLNENTSSNTSTTASTESNNKIMNFFSKWYIYLILILLFIIILIFFIVYIYRKKKYYGPALLASPNRSHSQLPRFTNDIHKSHLHV